MELFTKTVLREIEHENLAKKGWVCPSCGSAVSPNKDTCPKCEKEPVQESNAENRKVLLG
jgi:uncharacterized OB-fold protein